jgi:uncharacterized protein YggT (Ycf19 family)
MAREKYYERVTDRDGVVTIDPDGDTYEKYETRKVIYKTNNVVWYITGAVEAILGMRLLFGLFGANSANALVDFIYTLSAPLVAPFRGIFGSPAAGGYVLEWSTMLAMIVYYIIAYAVVEMFRLGKPVTVSEAEREV